MKVRDSIVLITGANRGIGKAFAEEFLKAGAKKIYLGVRHLKSVSDFAATDSRYVPLELDVTNPEHIQAAAKKAKDVTILINNAGVLHGGRLQDSDCLNNARHEMEVNYFGPLAMIQAFTPVLAKNGGGMIANMSSIAGLVAFPGIPTYCTSKAATHFLTLESRMELAPWNINVLGIYPGPVDTDMARPFDMPKVTPNHVAKEAIKAIEAEEDMLLPDPYSKEIYALHLKDPKLAAQKVQEGFPHEEDKKAASMVASAGLR